MNVTTKSPFCTVLSRAAYCICTVSGAEKWDLDFWENNLPWPPYFLLPANEGDECKTLSNWSEL